MTLYFVFIIKPFGLTVKYMTVTKSMQVGFTCLHDDQWRYGNENVQKGINYCLIFKKYMKTLIFQKIIKVFLCFFNQILTLKKSWKKGKKHSHASFQNLLLNESFTRINQVQSK